MHKPIDIALLIAALSCAALVVTSTAAARPHRPHRPHGQHQWFINPTHHGRGRECDEDNDNAVAGPFATQAACLAALAGGGDGPGGGGTGGGTGDGGTGGTGGGTGDGGSGGTGGTGRGGGTGSGSGGSAGAAQSALAGQSNASFLCYHVGGNVSVADSGAVATLESLGFWLPTAVAGNVDGGTNVGAFHLTCQAPGVAGVDGNAPPAASYADNNGDVLDFASAADTGWAGVYPIAEG